MTATRSPGSSRAGAAHEPTRHPARRALERIYAMGWWRELLLVAALYELYNYVQGLLTAGAGRAQRNGIALLAHERSLHLDPEHVLNQAIDKVPVLAVLACYAYAALHFLVTPAVLLWVHRYRRAGYAEARAVLALMTLTALIGFWLFPVVPPRLLPGDGFTDTLAHFSGWGWWSSDALPSAASRFENPYAAMPSLHVAWAAWSGATIFAVTRRRSVRAVAVAYPVLIAFVVLATANHYLADVVAGTVLWLVSLGVVRAARRIQARRIQARSARTRRVGTPDGGDRRRLDGPTPGDRDELDATGAR